MVASVVFALLLFLGSAADLGFGWWEHTLVVVGAFELPFGVIVLSVVAFDDMRGRAANELCGVLLAAWQ